MYLKCLCLCLCSWFTVFVTFMLFVLGWNVLPKLQTQYIWGLCKARKILAFDKCKFESIKDAFLFSNLSLAQFSHEPSTFKKALVNKLFWSKPWTARVILGLTMFACRQLMRVWLVQFSTNWLRLNEFSNWKRELIEEEGDNIMWLAPPLRPGPPN